MFKLLNIISIIHKLGNTVERNADIMTRAVIAVKG